MMRNSDMPDVLDNLMNQEVQTAGENEWSELEGRKVRSL